MTPCRIIGSVMRTKVPHTPGPEIERGPLQRQS